MSHNIVKAEILWTRKCNLRCPYCAMYDTEVPVIKKDWNQWRKGLENLKVLGGDNFFTAVYGAEPLQDFDYLPEYFAATRELDIYHTLITNCIGNDVKSKLTTLVDAGLNSLTVSFDGDEDELEDKNSSLKSGIGIETLRWFGKEFGDKVRDRAVVFTLTKTNLHSILKWIPKLSEEGIFVFFDLIHNDVGNPGTKCRNYPGIEKLLFTSGDDKMMLVDFGRRLKEMKDSGKYTIHQSNSFIDVLSNRPELYVDRKWHCAKDVNFPAWVTIDYDGTTRICDDFHVHDGKNWKFWDLTPEIFYGEFTEYWIKTAQEKCSGCFWNTHWDAHRITEGEEKFDDYINNCK